jgi:hypothetical protein
MGDDGDFLQEGVKTYLKGPMLSPELANYTSVFTYIVYGPIQSILITKVLFHDFQV